jgi:hypothetical protein
MAWRGMISLKLLLPWARWKCPCSHRTVRWVAPGSVWALREVDKIAFSCRQSAPCNPGHSLPAVPLSHPDTSSFQHWNRTHKQLCHCCCLQCSNEVFRGRSLPRHDARYMPKRPRRFRLGQ